MVLVYLPTKLGHLWGFYVGKYTSTMDDQRQTWISNGAELGSSRWLQPPKLSLTCPTTWFHYL